MTVSCGVGRRPGSDPELLWLWCRPVATAPIKPLAWERPYAADMTLKKKKKTAKERGLKPPLTFLMGTTAFPLVGWGLLKVRPASSTCARCCFSVSPSEKAPRQLPLPQLDGSDGYSEKFKSFNSRTGF